jgi:hypothetical protein
VRVCTVLNQEPRQLESPCEYGGAKRRIFLLLGHACTKEHFNETVKTDVERYLKRRATASTRGRQIWLSAIQPILNGEEFAGAASAVSSLRSTAVEVDCGAAILTSARYQLL